MISIQLKSPIEKLRLVARSFGFFASSLSQAGCTQNISASENPEEASILNRLPLATLLYDCNATARNLEPFESKSADLQLRPVSVAEVKQIILDGRASDIWGLCVVGNSKLGFFNLFDAEALADIPWTILREVDVSESRDLSQVILQGITVDSLDNEFEWRNLTLTDLQMGKHLEALLQFGKAWGLDLGSFHKEYCLKYIQNLAEFGVPSSSWFTRPSWLPNEVVTPRGPASHSIKQDLGMSQQGIFTRKYDQAKESQLFQFVKKCIKLEGLGHSGDGVSGTFNAGSLHTLLNLMGSIMQGNLWEFCDIGAGSSRVLAAGFAYGCFTAVGLELVDGPKHIFHRIRDQLERDFMIPPERFCVHYGLNVTDCNTLPTLSQVPDCRKAILAFCDGWNEVDRKHAYGLLGRDYLVHLFFTSPGKGKEDSLNNPSSILECVNRFDLSHNTDGTMCPFVFLGKLNVSMLGSGAKKTLLVFMRVNIPSTVH